MIQRLQRNYQPQMRANAQALDDAWERLTGSSRKHNHQEQSVQFNGMSSKTSITPTRRRTLRRRLDLLALVACLIILVGSMAVLFHALSQNRMSPAGSHPKDHATATMSLSPTISTSGIGTTVYTFHDSSPDVYAINSVDWAPDGKRIASTGTTVQVWDATTGGHLLVHTPSEGANFFVARWSPDGKRIASTVPLMDIWDAATGKTLVSCPYPNQPIAITTGSTAMGPLSSKVLPLSMGSLPPIPAWSPDGKYIALPYQYPVNPMIVVWNASNCKVVTMFSGFTDIPYAVAWSPDGKYLAAASADKTVRVWEYAAHQLIYTFHDPSGLGVYRLAWSPDGKRIASTDSLSHTVEVWDATTGGHLVIYRNHSQLVTSIAWSPDGKRIASGSSYVQDSSGSALVGEVQLWNPDTGKQLFTYRGNPNPVLAVAWSPDGKLIASSDGNIDVPPNDGGHSTVKVWLAE